MNARVGTAARRGASRPSRGIWEFHGAATILGTLKKDLERTSNVNRQSRGQCSSLRDWIGSLFTMFGDRARTTGYDCGRPGG